MGRNSVFISILALIAGICIGVLGMFLFVEPAPPLQPADTTISTPIVTASPSPAPDMIDPSEDINTLMSTATPLADLDDNRTLLTAAYDVLSALKFQDYQSLAKYVHPSEGVIFTPYSTVDLKANLCFTSSQVARLGKDTAKYVWGISDGKGDPLEMTPAEYFARYVYNADYSQAPMLGIDRIIGSGNALENVAEAFPASRFVEFYFPGIVPEYNGFDWCGLKLVFSEYKGEFKLRAIIHSEWTI